MMHLIDIDCLSNGEGKIVYGGRLDAYSFLDTNCEKWFNKFTNDISAAIGEKYYPVYRIADGELRFLFGPKINWKNKPIKSTLSYIKYKIFKAKWKTSWGEKYSKDEIKNLRDILSSCVQEIANDGKLAIYWNENGLNAFTEYNSKMKNLFSNINITLNSDNYIPFHFGQALIANEAKQIFHNCNVLFVSGLGEKEFCSLQKNVLNLGAKSVNLFKCSATSALKDNYNNFVPIVKPDIVLVAAGIGAAKVLTGLKHLHCPVIDIGSYIHVLSSRDSTAHAGFFVAPII